MKIEAAVAGACGPPRIEHEQCPLRLGAKAPTRSTAAARETMPDKQTLKVRGQGPDAQHCRGSRDDARQADLEG